MCKKPGGRSREYRLGQGLQFKVISGFMRGCDESDVVGICKIIYA